MAKRRDLQPARPWANLEERARLAVACRRDPQWRRMAEELAELKKPIDAYKAAGYAPHRGNATRLARQPEIRAYVEELMDEAAEFAGIRRVTVVNRIDRVGRANVADFYEIAGDTLTLQLKNIKELPRELTDALAGIEWQIVGEDTDGKPIRAMVAKLLDKNQANFALLKYLGGLPDEPARTQVNIFSALSIDDQAALADLIEAFPAGPNRAGGETAGEHRPGGAAP